MKFVLYAWFRVVAVLASIVMAGAQQAPAPTTALSLEDAIKSSLLNNRQLQIERINPDIARLTLKASYGYYDPLFNSEVRGESASDPGGFDPANPRAEAIFEADSEVVSLGLGGYLPSGLSYNMGGSYSHSSGTRNFLNFDSYKANVGITLQQPLLKNFWIDRPRWQIQVNKRNLKFTELGVQFVASSVINLVYQGYYDLVYAWENLRVHQSLLETREQFLRGIQRQVELGVMTALDEKIGRSQTAALGTDLLTASNQVALASNNLRTLMGIEEPNWSSAFLIPEESSVLVPQLLELQESWRTGVKQRADLLQLAVNLERADLTVKFRKNQLFPSLDLIGSYGLRGADSLQAFPPDEPKASRAFAFQQIEDQSSPSSMVGVLFSLPLTRTTDRANYKASKELQKQAQLILKQKEELILREIADAIDLAKFAFQRAQSAREAAQFASEAQAAEEQRLRGGTGSIFFVLQAQTDAARAKIAEHLAKRDYNKALAQLYFTEGTLLQRNQIEFRFD
jgi:outer membrane protein TolC